MQYRKGRPSPWKVSYRDHGGELKSKSFTLKADAEEFELTVKRNRRLTAAGLEAPIEGAEFLEFSKLYMRHREKARPRSFKQDGSRLAKYWVPRFKGRELASIKKEEIDAALDEITTKHKFSNANRNRHRSLLHTFFEFAIEKNKVKTNPVSYIKVLSEKKKKRKTGYWDSEDTCRQYIDAAYKKNACMGLLATILLYAGPRIGEALALTWEDVDFERGYIIVRKTMDRTGLAFEGTKGQKEGGEYLLPIFPVVRKALDRHRELTPFKGRKDYLIHDTDGKPLAYWPVRTQHEKLITEEELPRLTLHDFRRTFASNAERAGFSRGDVQIMLGHSSITTTENYIRKSMEYILERGTRVGFGKSEAPVTPKQN